MREIGDGLFEVEEGDSPELDKLHEHVEAIAKSERERLNKERGHEWWADAVFFVHDMVAFSGLLRTQLEHGELADALIQTTTRVAHSLLVLVFAGDEKQATQAWMTILEDGKTLDAVMSRRLAEERGEQTH